MKTCYKEFIVFFGEFYGVRMNFWSIFDMEVKRLELAPHLNARVEQWGPSQEVPNIEFW